MTNHLCGLFYIVAVFVSACTGIIPKESLPALSPAGAKVVIGQKLPGKGYQGPIKIEAKHGRGCGMVGKLGSKEGALIALQNKAAELGVDYVIPMKEHPPASDGECYQDEFLIEAEGFKKL